MGRAYPHSKRDRPLPYTYEGWIDALDGKGTEPVWHHYFCDTLCGLIEFLADEEMDPGKVKLYGVFRKEQNLNLFMSHSRVVAFCVSLFMIVWKYLTAFHVRSVSSSLSQMASANLGIL